MSAAAAKSRRPAVAPIAAALEDAETTRLKALSKGELVDAWGALRLQARALDEQIDAMKAEFERRRLKTAAGAAWRVSKRVGGFMGLRIPELKEAMGKAWCAKWEIWRERVDYDFEAAEKAK